MPTEIQEEELILVYASTLCVIALPPPSINIPTFTLELAYEMHKMFLFFI